ncbi:MAG: hypothetical protein E3J56_01060 [Candidatus Aminicenantes bacterium]|nr:MAG: hypothetical protein E3J56_01060 [Candidatus Aminicenantes bacterium]
MKIDVVVDKKLMPRTEKDDPESRPVIINYIISYPDIHGKIRYNTEDEIRKISLNFQEVIKEIDKWHEENKEEAKQ